MLSPDAIDNLIKPIIDRQEYINRYVLTKIAARIKDIGTMLPSDIYTLQSLMQSGTDTREINKFLSQQTNLQERDIKKIIKEIAADGYKDAKPFYDYREKSYVPFSENTQLQAVVTSIAAETSDTYHNIANSTAFMLPDKKDTSKLVPTSIARTYQNAVDTAIQAIQSGSVDYTTAMRGTIRRLLNSGLRYVTYAPKEDGRQYHRRLDTAVRMNILDGIRAVNIGVQDEVGKQFGANGKEISVHAMSAPDHEPIQGHQFTNEEYEKLQSEEPFTDTQGNKFDAIERHIGQWNCRHFAWSIIVGVTKPVYTPKQLQQFIDKNNKGYTLKSGIHLTLYECTQKMRQMETQIRRYKDSQIVAKASGDMKLAQEYQAKVAKRTQEYQGFCIACNLRPKTNNLFVDGYKQV